MKRIIPFFLIFLMTISSVLGFSTLSLDNIDFSANGDEFNNQFFLLISEDGTDDYAVGTFTSSQLSEEVTAEKGLKIETQVTDKTCSYDIRSSNEKIYRMELERTLRWNPFNDGAKEQECRQKGDFFFGFIANIFSYNCYYGTGETIRGEITDKTYYVKDNVKVTVGSETRTATVSNTDPTDSVQDVVVRWQGNLASGRDCPDMVEQIPFYNQKSGEWYLASRSSYTQLTAHLYTEFENCVADIKIEGDNKRNAEKCSDDYNRFLDNLLLPTSFSIKSSTGTISTSSSSSGVVEVPDVDLLQFPVLSLKINADWIGIVQPVTKPKIVSLSTECFKQGTVGYITAKVKNDGGSGAFSITASCQSPLKPTQGSIIKDIEAGETKDIQVSITGASLEEQKKECSITVKDRSDPSISDTKSVLACVSPVELCTAGAKRCNNNLIQQCNDAGSGYEIVQECRDECIIDDGEPVCKTVKDCSADTDCNEGETCLNGECTENVCVTTCELECDQKYSLLDLGKRQGCKFRCKPSCWFTDNLQWVIIGGSVLVLLIILIAVFASKPKGDVSPPGSTSARKRGKRRRTITV